MLRKSSRARSTVAPIPRHDLQGHVARKKMPMPSRTRDVDSPGRAPFQAPRCHACAIEVVGDVKEGKRRKQPNGNLRGCVLQLKPQRTQSRREVNPPSSQMPSQITGNRRSIAGCRLSSRKRRSAETHQRTQLIVVLAICWLRRVQIIRSRRLKIGSIVRYNSRTDLPPNCALFCTFVCALRKHFPGGRTTDAIRRADRVQIIAHMNRIFNVGDDNLYTPQPKQIATTRST